MTMQQIDIFLKCLALRSFRKVAQVLYLSPSTVARQMDALEQELGVTLFQRDSHNMLLTPEGKHFMEFAVDYSASYAELVARLSSGKPNPMDFSIGCYMCDGTFDTISSLILSYPSDVFTAPVRYTFVSEKGIQKIVRDKGVQVGIDVEALLLPYRNEFDMFPVSGCRYHLLVGLQHPLANTDSITLGRLVQKYGVWGDFLPPGEYSRDVADREIHSPEDFCRLAEFTIDHFNYIMPMVSKQSLGLQHDRMMLIVPENLRFLDDFTVHEVAVKGKGLSCTYMAFWRKDCCDQNIRTLTEMLRTLPGAKQ